MSNAKFDLGRTAKQTREEIWADVRNNERNYGESLLQIVDKEGEVVYFRDNIQQQRNAEIYARFMAAMIRLLLLQLKFRQLGNTLWWQKCAHTRLVSRQNHKAVIIAHRKDRAEEVLDTQEWFINSLPQIMQPNILTKNKYQFKIGPQMSSMFAASANDPEAMRGFIPPPKTLLLTEAAYYGEKGGSFKKLAGSGLQAVPNVKDAIVVAETTGNGTGDEFYDYFTHAVSGDNIWEWMFFEWFLDPQWERDFHDHKEDRARGITWEELRYIRDNCKHCYAPRQAFKETAKKDAGLMMRKEQHKLTWEQVHWYWYKLGELDGDRMLMQQEYPCTIQEAFIASGSPAFDVELLQQVLVYCKPGTLYELPFDSDEWADLLENDQLRRGKDPYLEVWEPPVLGHRYVVAADCSEGKKKSNPASAFVKDMDAGFANVAEIHGLIETDPYAIILMRVGRMYNVALQAPERNNMGISVCNKMIEENYPDMYQKHLLKPSGWEESDVIGWETNVQTKPFIVGAMRKLLFVHRENPKYLASLFKSVHLIQDLCKFTRGKAQTTGRAEAGAEDDRPMAHMIGLGVCIQVCGVDYTATDEAIKDAKKKQDELEKKREQKKEKKNVNYEDWNKGRKRFEAGAMPEDFDDDNEIVGEHSRDDDDE